MTDTSILTQLPFWHWAPHVPKTSVNPSDLHTLWQFRDHLPQWITDSPTIMRCWELLAPLDWTRLPERDLQRDWGHPTVPYAAFLAAELIRLNEPLPTPERLHRFLIEHPGFIWLLGFPLTSAPETDLGFNPRASLPTPRHFAHLLREMPNSVPQFLLADSVQLIRAELRRLDAPPIDCAALDTKHIIAWVKENNPKAYMSERYNAQYPPLGDPDCRLGCKRKHNRVTPTRNPRSASTVAVGEYYWGYGSGIVVTKIPGWGEFVLAEMTQPFDQSDATYFFPLMHQVEQRLGFRPRYGTFDAAFDAWYVYAHFYRENDPDFGFAAVPFSEKGNYKAKERQFDPQGLPLCKAGLAMPLKYTFTDRTKCIIEHERGVYVCPLHFPTGTAARCPAHHARWKHGGCTAQMPTSIGARLRHTLDRDSERYKAVYRQRTATERINSQAVALGIERPHLRNGQAITNENTLIYLLINLRFLQRLRAQ
ncbi:MAG: transposase [Chloroflexi bacterium]|nr:transposase [Chloroflexota bacterium]